MNNADLFGIVTQGNGKFLAVSKGVFSRIFLFGTSPCPGPSSARRTLQMARKWVYLLYLSGPRRQSTLLRAPLVRLWWGTRGVIAGRYRSGSGGGGG